MSVSNKSIFSTTMFSYIIWVTDNCGFYFRNVVTSCHLHNISIDSIFNALGELLWSTLRLPAKTKHYTLQNTSLYINKVIHQRQLNEIHWCRLTVLPISKLLNWFYEMNFKFIYSDTKILLNVKKYLFIRKGKTVVTFATLFWLYWWLHRKVTRIVMACKIRLI